MKGVERDGVCGGAVTRFENDVGFALALLGGIVLIPATLVLSWSCPFCHSRLDRPARTNPTGWTCTSSEDVVIWIRELSGICFVIGILGSRSSIIVV